MIDTLPGMVCPACGLPNDPAATACARCHAPMAAFSPPPRPAPGPGKGPGVPLGPPVPARGRRPLIAGIAVAVIVFALAGIGLVVFLRGTGDPVAGDRAPDATPAEPAAKPDGTATEQIDAIDAILADSVRIRRKLNAALDRVRRYTGLAGAVADMAAVQDERRAQLAAVAAAELSRVPGGEDLRKLLATALQRALEADQGFLGWARPAVSDGCAETAARRSAYAAGDRASQQAGTAKVAFLKAWNPVATANGRPARSRDDI